MKDNIKNCKKSWLTSRCFKDLGPLCVKTFIKTTIHWLFFAGYVFLKEKITNKKTDYQEERRFFENANMLDELTNKV